MNLNKQVNSTVTIATIASAAAVVGTYFYLRRRKNCIPEKWTSIGKVKELFIYPLKSGRRKEVQTAVCMEYGIKLNENGVVLKDRCFVVYGESNNEFKSAGTFPKLILIETSVNNNGDCVFNAPNQNPLIVKIPDSKEKQTKITLIKKEPCEGIDCGDQAAAWLSNYLIGKPTGLRLGYHVGVYKRNIEKQYYEFTRVYHNLKNYSGGLYQNLTSYLLVCQSSVDALNRHLTEPVSAHNFRPNILIEGQDMQPYIEEDWDWIKIADVVFRNVKLCTRCVVTTVDPDSGILSKKQEPLNTLEKTNSLKNPAHIKCQGKRGVMGIHLGVHRLGQIKVGDEVYIG